MSDLLIHSLGEFSEIILPVLELAEALEVVEIGAEYGIMTERLAARAAACGGRVTAIDPAPSPELEALAAGAPALELVRDTSLNVLSALSPDAALIDGDHNYYTVLQESNLLWERSRSTGKPFLAVYHDVGWPCARRDQYCDPDRIPEAYRHPHSWDLGVVLDDPGLVEGGFRGEGRWAVAVREGGAMNGVLTAVEDFVVGKEQHLVWASIPAVFGLGFLFANDAPWTAAVKQFLLPYHMNPLLERMERNRLECYLRVIQHQDQHLEQGRARAA